CDYRHAFLVTSNHNNSKNHYNNCSGEKQSSSQTLIPLTAIPHKEACHQLRNGEATDNNAKCYLGNQSHGDQGHRFDLRFFRPFRANLSIRKSSSFFPPLIAATSQRGLAPRPAQVSPDRPRYFGETFFPFKTLPPPRRPTTAIVLSILSNCFSISARCSRSISSTWFRRSTSASTVIRDRFTFGISDLRCGAKRFSLRGFREQSNSIPGHL